MSRAPGGRRGGPVDLGLSKNASRILFFDPKYSPAAFADVPFFTLWSPMSIGRLQSVTWMTAAGTRIAFQPNPSFHEESYQDRVVHAMAVDL